MAGRMPFPAFVRATLAGPVEPAAERFGARVAQLDLTDGGGPDIAGTVVPGGHVRVRGDRRGRSADGRSFGFVEADATYAPAVAVYRRRDGGLGRRKL